MTKGQHRPERKSPAEAGLRWELGVNAAAYARPNTEFKLILQGQAPPAQLFTLRGCRLSQSRVDRDASTSPEQTKRRSTPGSRARVALSCTTLGLQAGSRSARASAGRLHRTCCP